MSLDVTVPVSMLAFAALIALPAVAAVSRRRTMREARDVACALGAYAAAVRQSAQCLPLDENLRKRAQRLRVPELASLVLASELVPASPPLLADTAQRLALRLKRRVSFERKMLARTASGRWRGAVAAAIPPLLLLTLYAVAMPIPLAALLMVLGIEACGCWLLWRVARVEI